jgi:hypothetical protein
MVKQVPSFSVLHHHVDDPFLDQSVPQFDEVRVVDLAVQ